MGTGAGPERNYTKTKSFLRGLVDGDRKPSEAAARAAKKLEKNYTEHKECYKREEFKGITERLKWYMEAEGEMGKEATSWMLYDALQGYKNRQAK